MSRGKWKKYEGFRDFSRTYKRYVRDYYRKARSLYKKIYQVKSTKGVSKREVRDVMYDNSGPLSREQFAAIYKKYKNALREQDSTADPIQYVVNRAAYKYSEAQYRAFTHAAKDDKFQFFKGISREEFRTGSFRSEEFRRYLKDIYKQRKEELRKEFEESGKEWVEEEVIQQAAKEMSLYFGSP